MDYYFSYKNVAKSSRNKQTILEVAEDDSVNNIKTLIDQSFDTFIADLKEMIDIPSVYAEDDSSFPFGEPIDRALRKTLSLADKLGFKTYYDPEGYYGYADYGTGDEMIGVLGHLDVVPAGDLSKWNCDPFNAVIKDNCIFGRGTQDDKGPTLAAMYAFKAIVDSGASIDKTVRFIFGIDEELLWRSISKYVEKEQMPNVGFTPDSCFPVIFAEKGLLQVDLIAKNESGLVFSGGDAYNAVPSLMSIETEKANELENALNDHGFEFKRESDVITVIGKSMHAKDADKGINAISRTLMAAKSIGWESNTINFVNEVIGEDALAAKIFGDCQDEASGSLKFYIGKVELNAEHEILNVDMRIPVTVEKEFVWEKLEAAVKPYGFEMKQNDYLRSIYTPLDAPLVENLVAAYQEVTGDLESKPLSSGGATYARAIDNCVAFGAAFPRTKETEHQPNECIDLDELKEAMAIYASAFLKLLG